MSDLHFVATAQAPQAIGPYSQGVIANGVLYTAGQVALDPATMALVPGDVKAQTDRVLLNLWATWCVPCRKEMPALEGLQTRLGGPNFEVVAINIDTRDPQKPKNFLKEAQLTRLGYFSDDKAKVFQDLKAVGRALGMPTSVLIDGQGCEIATIAGPADWDSDDAVKLITAAMNPVAAGL